MAYYHSSIIIIVALLGLDLGKVNRLALHHEVASMLLINLTISIIVYRYNIMVIGNIQVPQD